MYRVADFCELIIYLVRNKAINKAGKISGLTKSFEELVARSFLTHTDDERTRLKSLHRWIVQGGSYQNAMLLLSNEKTSHSRGSYQDALIFQSHF